MIASPFNSILADTLTGNKVAAIEPFDAHLQSRGATWILVVRFIDSVRSVWFYEVVADEPDMWMQRTLRPSGLGGAKDLDAAPNLIWLVRHVATGEGVVEQIAYDIDPVAMTIRRSRRFETGASVGSLGGIGGDHERLWLNDQSNGQFRIRKIDAATWQVLRTSIVSPVARVAGTIDRLWSHRDTHLQERSPDDMRLIREVHIPGTSNQAFRPIATGLSGGAEHLYVMGRTLVTGSTPYYIWLYDPDTLQLRHTWTFSNWREQAVLIAGY